METLEELQNKRQDLLDQIKTLRDARSVYDKKISTLWELAKKLDGEIDTMRLAKPGVDWNILLEETGSSSGELNRAAEKELNSRGLRDGGYYPETQQRALKVVMTKDDPENLEKTITALEEILPFVKPLKEVGRYEKIQNVKPVGIFEHTLSEHGIYELYINDDGYYLGKTTYGSYRTLRTFASLREALSFIQEHHWYENPNQKDKYWTDDDDEEES